jgi:hypothetical protein
MKRATFNPNWTYSLSISRDIDYSIEAVSFLKLIRTMDSILAIYSTLQDGGEHVHMAFIW